MTNKKVTARWMLPEVGGFRGVGRTYSDIDIGFLELWEAMWRQAVPNEVVNARKQLGVRKLTPATFEKIQQNVLKEGREWTPDAGVDYLYRKQISKCVCGRVDYTDCMIKHPPFSGTPYCRVCSYERFERETDGAWKQGEEGYTYPIHKNGKDYRILTQEEKDNAR